MSKTLTVGIGILVGISSIAQVHAQDFTEDLKLTASDAASPDLFGWSVAMNNGVVVVGSPLDDDQGFNSGSAYLYDAAAGTELLKLTAVDGADRDEFGFSVDMADGIVVVGAYLDDDHGSGSGSAYLFDATTGMQLAKLTASDAMAGVNFGWSVAIDGGIVAVSAVGDNVFGFASGSVYLFDAATGVQISKLAPNDGEGFDLFGFSVDIDGDTLVIGAPGGGDQGSGSGSAYTFNAATGMQISKLLSSDGETGHRFGVSVAIDDGIAVVGAPSTREFGPDTGSAYIFDAITGTQSAKLNASDATFRDEFGTSVGIDNGIVAVGAVGEDDFMSANFGTAYLFSAATGVQIARFSASDEEIGDELGFSIGIDNGVVVAGAPHSDDQGSSSGSAYVFDVTCSADLTGDFELNFLDVSAFLAAFGNQDSIADFTGDGQFNFLDVSAFLQAFGVECP